MIKQRKNYYGKGRKQSNKCEKRKKGKKKLKQRKHNDISNNNNNNNNNNKVEVIIMKEGSSWKYGYAWYHLRTLRKNLGRKRGGNY